MKKARVIRPGLILLASSLLSGCIWWPEEDGYRRGNNYERDRGDHHGQHRDNRGERREHQENHEDRGGYR